jgi:hypothetical protein
MPAHPRSVSCLGNLVILCPGQAKDKAVTRTNPSNHEDQGLQGQILQGQVLQFRPRGSLFTRNLPRPPLVPDLSKFESPREEPDDFKHRMLMNGLGFAITVLLILGGVWIADVMAHIRKDQDCYLTGRSNCAPIAVPAKR